MIRPPSVLVLLLALSLAGCGDGDSAPSAKNAEQDARIDALADDAAALRARLSALDEIRIENEALRAQNAGLRASIDELRAEIEESRRPLEDLTEAASVLRCQTHLRQLWALFTTDQMENPGRPRYSGSALLLYYRKKGFIETGSEEVLLCDRDPLALHPGGEVDSAAWDAVDLTAPPRGYCSYAVRDLWKHPFGACAKLALACCPHHPEGAVVAFEDGSVELVTRERLGLSDDEAITVGPDARSELLRPLVYRVE